MCGDFLVQLLWRRRPRQTCITILGEQNHNVQNFCQPFNSVISRTDSTSFGQSQEGWLLNSITSVFLTVGEIMCLNPAHLLKAYSRAITPPGTIMQGANECSALNGQITGRPSLSVSRKRERDRERGSWRELAFQIFCFCYHGLRKSWANRKGWITSNTKTFCPKTKISFFRIVLQWWESISCAFD